MTETELIEALASAEHASWSRWMDYLFSKCDLIDDREGYERYAIPRELMERWQRQVETPYAELSEREKQSDRNEVAHILPLIVEYAYGKGDGLTIVKRALDFRTAMQNLQTDALSVTTQTQLDAIHQSILNMIPPVEPSE